MALICEQRHIFLAPNGQVDTIAKLAQLCDMSLGELPTEQLAVIPFNLARNTDIVLDNDLLITPNCDELFDLFNSNITFFTSGSTGTPKAIVKHTDLLNAEIETLYNTFKEDFDVADTIISTVSHQHIYGLLFKVLLPLKKGISIVIKMFEYPEHISQHLARNVNQRVLWISSPAHLKRLVNDNVVTPYHEQLIRIFSSGGTLDFEVSQLIKQQLGQAPIEVYGSTETGGIAWRHGQLNTFMPWTVFEGIEIKRDTDSGCLQIISPFVTNSYYLTDDLIDYLDEKHFLLIGRADRTVKLEEKRINLSHMEYRLCQHDYISDAKVLLIKQGHRELLAAVVELSAKGEGFLLNKGKRQANDLFKMDLLTEFERICLPRKWRYVEALPFNSQGKLLLAELECLFV